MLGINIKRLEMICVEKVLIVDDSASYRMIISTILSDYNLLMAEDGLEALEFIEAHNDIDIMILDLKMPRLDGFGVLDHLRTNNIGKDITIIILTNVDEIDSEIKGLDAGAVDYIRKPINADSLQKRIEVHQKLIQARKEISLQNHLLEERVLERTKRLEQSQKLTIDALVGLLEIRDVESSNHGKRTQYMMQALGNQLMKASPYSHLLSKQKIHELYRTSPLHDIGKVGVQDCILLKPGRLTVDEYDQMKKHVDYGTDSLKRNIEEIEGVAYVETALRIMEDHHERYDGKGYPCGKKGDEISLEGRMMGIVDVYDALRSKRVYKEAYDHQRAMAIIMEERGKHFDPVIVDAFNAIEDQIIEIVERYGVDI
jgi:putative two-component system response regulator